MLLLQGENAQGKTNLLEAIHLLSLTRSFRADTERELVSWQAEDGFARVRGEAETAGGKLEVEVFIQAVSGQEAKKRLKVNGLPRRAMEVVGQLPMVLFTVQEIEMVSGPPSLRRRYLDIAASQLDARYLRSLQQYHRVLEQRNHLLRRIQEGRAQAPELEFWDRELVAQGCYLMEERDRLVQALEEKARQIHHELAGGELRLSYLPSLGEESLGQEELAFRRALERGREREISLGMTLVGPHRDELRFWLGERDMGIYGSRGQQRTIVLALKLAEGQVLWEKRGDCPLLLLDDVLSELDYHRRRQLWQAVLPYQQVVITTTELEVLDPTVLAPTARFQIREGAIYPF